LDVEWWILCDPQGDDQVTFMIDDGDELTAGLIIGMVNSSSGCPVPTASPSPTPAFSPKCTYVHRWDVNTTLGVSIDLAYFNDGPFGVKSSASLPNGQLYIQPCERMTCPPLFTCPETPDELSSAWMCNMTDLTCKSYGIAVEAADIRPINNNLSEGLVLNMANPAGTRSVSLSLTCETWQYPSGHIDWASNATVDSQTLNVSGAVLEACLDVVEPPGNQTCNFSIWDDSLSLDLDLEKLNAPGGWRAFVNVQGIWGYPDSWLYYQPCGSIPCPAGWHCQGVEDAAIWLCREDSDLQLCTAFGLWENNLTMSLIAPPRIDGGVKAAYIGDMKHDAIVQYFCNRSMPDDALGMPQMVTMVGEQMRFIAMSRGACVLPDPTASPVSTMPLSPGPTDVPTVSPGPSEVPSVSVTSRAPPPTAPPVPTTSQVPTPEPAPDQGSASATGGSVFMMIVLVGGLLYFVVGILWSFVRTGNPEIPNNRFWTEVRLCIVTAVKWILTCGRVGVDAHQYERV
jgi:hypothetical protein